MPHRLAPSARCARTLTPSARHARTLTWLAVGAALALAGCASNQELAAKRCAGVAGQRDAYDQCVARESANLARAQEWHSGSSDGAGGGGGGY